MKKMIQSASVLCCLAMMAACVPEPLTGTDSDMGGGGTDMTAMTPDTGGGTMDMMTTPTDSGGGETDTGGEVDMPAGPTNPFMVTDAAAVTAGETLFMGNGCSGCHNEAGTAVSKVPLTETAGKEDVFLYTSIRDGIAPKNMPAYGPDSFGTPLTDDEMWQLVTYLKATYAP